MVFSSELFLYGFKSLFGKPGPHSACQNYDFHEFSVPGWIALWNAESFLDDGC
jgi:hypothetical protein